MPSLRLSRSPAQSTAFVSLTEQASALRQCRSGSGATGGLAAKGSCHTGSRAAPVAPRTAQVRSRVPGCRTFYARRAAGEPLRVALAAGGGGGGGSSSASTAMAFSLTMSQ